MEMITREMQLNALARAKQKKDAELKKKWEKALKEQNVKSAKELVEKIKPQPRSFRAGTIIDSRHK